MAIRVQKSFRSSLLQDQGYRRQCECATFPFWIFAGYQPNEESIKMNRMYRIDRSRRYLAWAMIFFIPTVLSASESVLGYELVGQVLNVSASQSLQYGYL